MLNVINIYKLDLEFDKNAIYKIYYENNKILEFILYNELIFIVYVDEMYFKKSYKYDIKQLEELYICQSCSRKQNTNRACDNCDAQSGYMESAGEGIFDEYDLQDYIDYSIDNLIVSYSLSKNIDVDMLSFTKKFL